MKKFIYTVYCVLLAGWAFAQDPAYPPVPAAPQNITAAEYFIDTDPGIGLATAITITPGVDLSDVVATINTTGLTVGSHRLSIRTRNNEGKWSITFTREFLYNFDIPYSNAPAVAQNITGAEYFIDTDPGIGNGTAIVITPGVDISNITTAVSTTGLSNGAHRVYLRTRSNEGNWSIINVKEFIVDFNPAYPSSPAAAQNVIAAEYFIDTDPGIGNATNIPLTAGTDITDIAVNPSLVGLTNGAHRLYIRSRSNEGRWSITNIKDFLYDADPQYTSTPAAPGNIVKAEYFFDTDPGFGNASAISITPGIDISNIAFAANTSSLTDGNHTLFIRSLDDWSVAGYTSFLVGNALPLRFLSFMVLNKQNNVELQWKTDNEINTSHFDIERSADGVSFEKIGKTTAANSAGVHQYSFTDDRPLDKNSYYRLRQVDKDAKAEYSKVIAINRLLTGNDIAFYPNPAKDQVYITLPFATRVKTISIIDARGGVLKNVAVNTGTNRMTVNIQQLPAGVYFIGFYDGKEQQVRRFVKE